MTQDDVLKMTTDELRDWLARDDGWGVEPITQCFMEKQHANGSVSFGHPYPPTLDGAAKALPPEFDWGRHDGEDGTTEWYAHRFGRCHVWVKDTGDEIRDRFVLAVLARIKAKGGAA